jgi:hypothetical protein
VTAEPTTTAQTTAAPLPEESLGGGALATLRRLLDDEGDTFLLALVRIGFGLLLLNEARLATEHYRIAGFFGTYFHQPYLPAALVPSQLVYQGILGCQWTAALLVLSGRWARPALVAAAAILLYTMLSDRLWFHHYRHTMLTFSTLLSLTPCDRRLVVLRAAGPEPAPLWAQHLIKAQVSLMYLASGGSKLFDSGWRDGPMMHGLMHNTVRVLAAKGAPEALVEWLDSPLAAKLSARGAITTELALAIFLWSPRTRRAALWVGLFFHLTISAMTPVRLFTAEMLFVYLLFATPDARARTFRYDPVHAWAGIAMKSFDWLRRYRVEQELGVPFTVVGRDGVARTGASALAIIAGTLPILFPLWPLFAIVAWLTDRTGRAAPLAPALIPTP